jgi:hypothetical protein
MSDVSTCTHNFITVCQNRLNKDVSEAGASASHELNQWRSHDLKSSLITERESRDDGQKRVGAKMFVPVACF